MRKRQWKKILSVVLALAMVFSMNITAFADEATDPVAVEEPAAEEPVAEAPVDSNEENPTETNEEPAAEEPAAEEPAPAEEAAPAEGEEPAGTALPTGYTITGGEEGPGYDFDGTVIEISANQSLTITIGNSATAAVTISNETDQNGAFSIVNDSTDGSAPTVTVAEVAGGELSGTVGEGTVLVDSNDDIYIEDDDLSDETYSVYKDTITTETTKATSTEINYLTGALGTGVTAYDSTGAEKTAAQIEAAATVSTNYYFVKSGALVVRQVAKKQATPAFDNDYDVTGTKIIIDGTTTADQFETFKGGESIGTTDGAASSTEIGGLSLATTYTVKKRTVSSSAAFKSDWSEARTFKTNDRETIGNGDTMVADSDFLLTANGQVFTVSGLDFTAVGGAARGYGISDNKGIFEVTVSEGTVKVTLNASQQAVSINVIENGNVIIDSEDDGSDPKAPKLAGSMITLKGTKTVSFASTADYGKIFTDDDINVEGSVSLSTNEAGTALVVSGNNFAWTVNGTDPAVSMTGKVKVYKAAVAATGFATAGNIDLAKNTIVSTAGDKYVISNNKVFKLGAGAEFNVEECGANDAVGYGKVVIWSSTPKFGDGTLNYQVLPKQETYELGKYTIELTSGAITNGGIDLDRVVLKKDGKTYLYNADRSSVFGAYQFALSTNATMKDRDLYEATYDVANNYVHNSALVAVDTLGNNAEAGKQYTLYARRKAGTGFASKAIALGSFTLKADEKLVIDSTIGTIYYGGQGKDASGAITDAIDSGDIKFTLGSYTIKKDATGDLSAYNAAGKKIGEIGVYVFNKTTFDINKAALTAASVSESDADNYKDFANADGTHTLKDMVSANGYYVEAFFNTNSAEREELSNPLSSNILSFNVLPAPATIKTKDASAPVGKYLTTDNLKDEGWIAVNDLTGAVVTGEFSGSAVYQVNGKLSDEVSFNAATVTTYTVSEGKIAPTVKGEGATVVLSKIEPGKLTIFGEVQKSGVTVTPGTVYYGENAGTIKGNMKVTYNNGAETIEAPAAAYAVAFYKPESLSDGSVSLGSVPVTPESTDAETQVAAIVTIDKTKIVGTNSENIVMPAVTFTIQKRPINIAFTDFSDATGTGLHSKRNIELKKDLSANKAKLNVVNDEVANVPEDDSHKNSGTLNPATDKENVLSKNALLDTAYINIEKAGTYNVPVSNLELATKYAKNFVITGGYASYNVEPVYYAYYILEYGGHDTKVGQKTVYQEVQETNTGFVTWSLPKELSTVSGFANFGGAIKDENDKVVEFKAKNYDGSDKSLYSNDSWWPSTTANRKYTDFSTAKGVQTDTGDGDVYFYAIVEAHATNNVVIRSLAPVTYDGRKHTIWKWDYKKDDRFARDSKSINPDITDLNLFDTSNNNNKALKLGVDFKVTVKNNTNASVKYDRSTSASNNTSDRGAVTQLFDANKRPQVVITGLGDYKGLKATVYFDILPRDINTGVGVVTGSGVNPDAGKLQTVLTNYLKLGKKKGVKYSYKVTDNIEGDVYTKGANVPSIVKKATLKKNKDYTESFVKTYMGASKAVDPKELTESGVGYEVVLDGTGNYYGTVNYPVTVIAKDAVLFSELGWSAKSVAYKATGVSTDSVKGNFNVKASKKYNKKALAYNTDYTATIFIKDPGTSLTGDGNDLALNAGAYWITIAPTAAFTDKYAADIKAGKLIDDFKVITAKVKGKKLNKKKFTVTPSAKGVPFSGDNFDVSVTSTAFKAGTDYIPLPGKITSTSATWGGITAKEKAQIGDSIQYLSTTTGLINKDYGTENSMAYNTDGNQVDTDVFEYTFTAANAKEREGVDAGNYKPGTYYINIIGTGAYNGSVAALTYKVKPAELTNKNVQSKISQDEVTANINGATTTITLALPYEVTAYSYNPATSLYDKARKTKSVTQYDQADTNNDGKGDVNFFTIKKWAANTKATQKAKVTFVTDELSGYMTNSKGVTATYKIGVASLSKNNVISYNEFVKLPADKTEGVFYVSIEDKADKAAAPKVTVYQAKENGNYGKAIKLNTDYTFTTKATGTSDNTISLNAGKGKNSSYKVNGPIEVKKYDVYSASSKSWELKLSANAVTMSSNKKWVETPMELNAKEDSGTVEYTGQQIKPVIQYLKVGDVVVVENGKETGKGAGYDLEMTTTKVGTNKYTIKLKKAADGTYTVGGSKTYSFKVVPQKSTGLILSE